MVFLIVVLVLVADQISKYCASHFLPLHQPQPFLGAVCSLTLVRNKGAAFGILQDQQWVFIVASLIASGVITVYLLKHHSRNISLSTLAAALILAGAVGNLIDRVRLGYVIDFIDVHVWPVFNLADSAITIGAVFLGFRLICAPPGRKG